MFIPYFAPLSPAWITRNDNNHFNEALGEVDDPTILAWAAEHNYILLTHDRATMPDFAFERVLTDKPMPGVSHMGTPRSFRLGVFKLS